MPDLQSPTPAPAVPVTAAAVFSPLEDADFAFGCECADPALQIPCWGQDAGLAAEAS